GRYSSEASLPRPRCCLSDSVWQPAFVGRLLAVPLACFRIRLIPPHKRIPWLNLLPVLKPASIQSSRNCRKSVRGPMLSKLTYASRQHLERLILRRPYSKKRANPLSAWSVNWARFALGFDF